MISEGPLLKDLSCKGQDSFSEFLFPFRSTGDGEGGDVGRRLEEGDNDGEDGEGSEGEDGEASEGEEEEDGEEEDTGTSGEEGEEGLDLIEVDETPKSERWDCESFLR